MCCWTVDGCVLLVIMKTDGDSCVLLVIMKTDGGQLYVAGHDED